MPVIHAKQIHRCVEVFDNDAPERKNYQIDTLQVEVGTYTELGNRFHALLDAVDVSLAKAIKSYKEIVEHKVNQFSELDFEAETGHSADDFIVYNDPNDFVDYIVNYFNDKTDHIIGSIVIATQRYSLIKVLR